MDKHFSELGLGTELQAVIKKIGFELPTPIQAESIPVIQTGVDLIAQAATGTGKTAAFGLPIVQRLLSNEQHKGDVFALVLVPTRELALQVTNAISSFAKDFDINTVAVYGGEQIDKQLKQLRRGADIVIATPGRALDHIKRKSLALDNLQVVVLDEADEMLDMGFADELNAILERTPSEKQTLLFSATIPPRVDSIAKNYLNSPERIRIAKPKSDEENPSAIAQQAYFVTRKLKLAAFRRILDVNAPAAAIVFCKSRAQVDELTDELHAKGHKAEALHGGFSQQHRDRVMARLRNKSSSLLIATDVAARGLDIDHLSHVINYDLPQDTETYVHRIGRVGRAGRTGIAITLIDPRDRHMVRSLERVSKGTISVLDIPSKSEIRNLQLKNTATTIADAIDKDNVANFKDVLDSLALEHGAESVALAALKLVHNYLHPEDEKDSKYEHIDIDLSAEERKGRFGKGRKRESGQDSWANKGGKRFSEGKRFGENKRSSEGKRFGDDKRSGEKSGPRRRSNLPMTKLSIGMGRNDGIRPKDIVGAIANEAGIRGSDIGGIEIDNKHSTVEVPTKSANAVLSSLKDSSIRGKRFSIRRTS